MNWKKIIHILLFTLLLLVPTKALAVDFTIPKVTIDVQLLEDGNADVVEKHTYEFDGKFNGIIRELIPKKGSTINGFEAFENSKPLQVEVKNDEYRVHREGKNETILIELHYEIVNGMEKYIDGAQFYWPFFDKRNETDYGDMMITIHPPSTANDVLFLGYDSAYEKGMPGSNGIVVFRLGDVQAGENGDIRVVYSPEFFPAIIEQGGTIRNEILAEKTRLAEEVALYATNKEKTKDYGIIGMSTATLLLIALIGIALKKRRVRKLEALYLLKEDQLIVPPQKMSLPATIYYTNAGQLTPEVTAAALLDIVRQGSVKQLSEDQFQQVDRNLAQAHELALIDLLFDKIGDGTNFNIADLETYTENKKNHYSYSESLLSWRTGIINEVKEQALFENNIGFRWLLVLFGAAMAAGAVQFARYELYLLMMIAIVFTFGLWLLAIFYKPRNTEGHLLFEEWQKFRLQLESLNLDDWDRLPTDDKFRAYTYAIGVKDKNFSRHFTEFASAEKRTEDERESFGFFYYNPTLMTSSFTSANNNANVDASGTSTSSSSSGGGTGGGGGGSGAF